MPTGNPFQTGARTQGVRKTGIAADQLSDENLLAGLGAGGADVAEQASEQAWQYAQVYDSRRGSVRAWLTTIAHSLAAEVIRARTSAPVNPEDLPALLAAMTDAPERLVAAHDNAAGLRGALARPTAAQARAVAMAGIYGMAARRIADAEGISLGTAKARIRDST